MFVFAQTLPQHFARLFLTRLWLELPYFREFLDFLEVIALLLLRVGERVMGGFVTKLGVSSSEMLLKHQRRLEGAAASFYWTLIHSNFKFLNHIFR